MLEAAMRLIKVGGEHLESLARLESLCFAHPMSLDNLKMLLPDGIGDGFVMLDDKDEAVAYGGVIFVLDEGQILNIATHPDHRRRGYGRIIMDSILELARERSISFVTLEVRESNAAAIGLYESLGFYEVGRLKGYYDTPKEDGLILRKDLI